MKWDIEFIIDTGNVELLGGNDVCDKRARSYSAKGGDHSEGDIDGSIDRRDD